MLLARVNCADWSHVCTKQNVTEFPVVKMYKEGQNPVSYTGMLGTEDLLKFIQLYSLKQYLFTELRWGEKTKVNIDHLKA